MPVSNKTVMKNVIWRYTERFLAQGVSFAVSLVLARLLDPGEYGTVAIVSVIVSMLDVFSSRGFVQALIQKKEVDHIDYSTVFFTNLGIEIVLYIVLFLLAPYIASFYSNGSLVLFIRVLSIRLIINSFNTVQQTYVQRNMQYKKFFFSTLIGTIISAAVGITMAYSGFGAWALVAQSLANTIIDTLVLFLTVDWKPRLEYSVQRVKDIWRYGIKMLAAGLLESVYNEIRSLVIGKTYTSSDLAYYNKGQNLPMLVVSNVQISIGNVFFSALSRESSYDETKEKTRAYFRVIFYVMAPLLVGMATVATPLLIVLYTDKWIAAAPYMVIYCFSYLTWCPQMTWLQAINSRGKAGTSLGLLTIHRIIGICLIIILIFKGPLYIAISALVADCIITVLIFGAMRKIFEYRIWELQQDIGKTLILTVVMAVSVLGVQQLFDLYWLKLILGFVVGVVVYIVGSLFLKPDGFMQLWNLLVNKWRGR